jgi:hypothetical protein
VTGFKDNISTFTSDQSGDEYERVDHIFFNPLLGISLSSRDILKFRFENPVIARS